MEPVSAALSVQAMVLRDVRAQLEAAAPRPGAQPSAPSADVILSLSSAAQHLIAGSQA